MASQSTCPECAAPFPSTPALHGKKVRCKKCDHIFVVKPPAKTERMAEVRKREPSRKPDVVIDEDHDRDSPRSRSRMPDVVVDEDYDDEDSPRARSSGAGSGLTLGVLIGGLGVASLVGFLIVCTALGLFTSPSGTPIAIVAGGPIAPNPPPQGGPNPNPVQNPNPVPVPTPGAGGKVLLQPTKTRIQLECTDSDFRSGHFASNGKLVGVYHKTPGDNKHHFDLYDLATEKHLGRTALRDAPAGQDYAAALSPEGQFMLIWPAQGTGPSAYTVIYHQPGNGKVKAGFNPIGGAPRELSPQDRYPVMVEFLDDSTLAALTRTGWYEVWGFGAGLGARTRVQIPQVHQPLRRGANALGQGGGDFVLSPDRTLLAVFNGEGYQIVEAATGKLVSKTARVNEPQNLAHRKAVVFSPDGKRLVSLVSPPLGAGETIDSVQDSIYTWPVLAGAAETAPPTTLKVRRHGGLQGNLDAAFNPDALSWWGDKTLLVHDANFRHAHLIDLDTGAYVQSLFTNFGSGRHLLQAPDQRFWYANGATRGGPSVLASLEPPLAAVRKPAPRHPGAIVGWGLLSPDGIESEPRAD